jgi:hypothetical protein
MRSFTFVLGLGLLSFCLTGLLGCGEDNEAASRDSAAKGTATVDPSKSIPQSKDMADYMKNNPGMKGAGTGASGKGESYPGVKK